MVFVQGHHFNNLQRISRGTFFSINNCPKELLFSTRQVDIFPHRHLPWTLVAFHHPPLDRGIEQIDPEKCVPSVGYQFHLRVSASIKKGSSATSEPKAGGGQRRYSLKHPLTVTTPKGALEDKGFTVSGFLKGRPAFCQNQKPRRVHRRQPEKSLLHSPTNVASSFIQMIPFFTNTIIYPPPLLQARRRTPYHHRPPTPVPYSIRHPASLPKSVEPPRGW